MVAIECQTAQPLVVDQGVGPDLIHRECALVVYRSVFRYLPRPRLLRFDAIDANGAIRGTLHFVPGPPEIQAPDSQRTPHESTHEIE